MEEEEEREVLRSSNVGSEFDFLTAEIQLSVPQAIYSCLDLSLGLHSPAREWMFSSSCPSSLPFSSKNFALAPLLRMAGKSTQSNKDTSSTSQPKKRPAASEIDDIFSKKSKPAPTTSSTSIPAETGVANKKKKDKKGKGKAEAEVEVQKKVEVIAQPKKIPETVVDTSSAIESYKPTAVTATKKAKDLTEEERKAIEEEKAFMDSRGTSSYASRFTGLTRAFADLALRRQGRRRKTVFRYTILRSSRSD